MDCVIVLQYIVGQIQHDGPNHLPPLHHGQCAAKTGRVQAGTKEKSKKGLTLVYKIFWTLKTENKIYIFSRGPDSSTYLFCLSD